ncbi:MAG: cell wall-binding repeat-containing protein [Conexibacter sp.]|nr:cell wall-binding repeat-containing protein [Conexibacter sp.]
MFYVLATSLRRRAGAAAILVIAAALLAMAASATAARRAQAPDDDRAVSPPPPSQPTRANGDTKHTTRLFGNTAAQKAVAVTQHVYPADGPTGLDDSFPDDRPRAVTLVTPDDPLTAIAATPLIHFPDNAPVLYVNGSGIPKITQDEIRRLKPVGISRANGLQAFVVGAAANPGVIADVEKLGLKHQTVTAADAPSLANEVDKVYGQIANPDTGYPIMQNSATGEGSTITDVLVGSMEDYQFVLPATHWVSHMPTALLWVTKDSVPQATIDAIQRRNGRAQIYLFGGPGVVSSAVFRELNKYGAVSRISEDDDVAFNSPAPNTPLTTSVAFSKMWDPVGMMGWNIVTVGHGFTVVRQDDWQGAVGSAILSHLGFHAPLLMTDNAATLPPLLDAYYKAVAPAFRVSPADGPYNMSYIIGDYKGIAWRQQAQIDHDSGMTNRRVPQQNTGGSYEPPR